MSSIGERLRDERVRLGFSQGELGAAAGVTKNTQLLYESDKRSPKADYLLALHGIGVNTHFVLTGSRSITSGDEPLSLPVGGSGSVDVEQLVRIADRLDAIAQAAGKRLPVAKLVEIAADVYNYFQHEEGIEDEEKLNRTLKLVVSR